MTNRVSLDLFRTTSPTRAIFHMALDHIPLKISRDTAFYKLLGTGRGETFGLNDANPQVWGLLTVSKSSEYPASAEKVCRRWSQHSTEHVRFTLKPIMGKGEWGRKSPFDYEKSESQLPVAVITRARIKPSEWQRFYAQVPDVVRDLHTQPGLKFRIGIGEAPIGLQGTFSIWESAEAINQFAYKNAAHSLAIHTTHQRQWYSEELFARFAVESISGTWAGLNL